MINKFIVMPSRGYECTKRDPQKLDQTEEIGSISSGVGLASSCRVGEFLTRVLKFEKESNEKASKCTQSKSTPT